MSQQLKVGQVWKDREGNAVTIIPDVGRDNVRHGSTERFPFRGSNDKSYTTRGTVWSTDESEHDLIELIRDVPDSDGWLEWGGGECPVSDGTLIDVEYRDGVREFSIPANVWVDGKVRNAWSCFWGDEGLTNDIVAYRVVEQPAEAEQPAESEQPTPNPKHAHCFKSVAHLDTVDVYRVCELFGVTDQAIGHAIKKLLCAGQRGVKDQRKDVQEAIDTLTRRVAMWQEDEVEK